MAQGTDQSAAHKPRLRDVSAITAVVSVIIALVFNAVQVKDSADQARQTKTATELQSLTQLNGLIAEAQAAVDPTSPEFTAAGEGKLTLPRQTNLRFGQVLRNMDYLAWLFDRRFITIPGAREIWGQRMKCFYYAALFLYGPSIAPRVTNLAQFAGPPPARGNLRRLVDSTC